MENEKVEGEGEGRGGEGKRQSPKEETAEAFPQLRRRGSTKAGRHFHQIRCCSDAIVAEDLLHLLLLLLPTLLLIFRCSFGC